MFCVYGGVCVSFGRVDGPLGRLGICFGGLNLFLSFLLPLSSEYVRFNGDAWSSGSHRLSILSAADILGSGVLSPTRSLLLFFYLISFDDGRSSAETRGRLRSVANTLFLFQFSLSSDHQPRCNFSRSALSIFT